jgi:hypothetical protein
MSSLSGTSESSACLQPPHEMMFKIRQGLTLQQSLKYPGLVHRFLQGHQDLNLTQGYHPLDPILCILHPSLKIANCREYLEPQAGLSGSMRNSNLIHSDLSASVPSTLSIFFNLETKGMEGGGSRAQKGGKAAADLENLLMAIVWIEILQQKCDHIDLF